MADYASNVCATLPNPTIPRTVALELLWGCNLKCNYCYIGIEKNWHQAVVPRLPDIFPIIDKIAQAGVEEIYFVGGEPTAHPKFAEICIYTAHTSIPVRGLCTNGTLMTHPLAELLKSLDFFIDISFRGASSEVFDHVTGITGSFEKALRGARILAEVGLSVGIEYDCTAQTAHELYRLIRTLVDTGIHIHQIFLHRISPSGDASYLADKGQMTLEDYQGVFEQARRIKTEFAITTTFEDGFPLCLTDQENWEFIVPCECGTFFATVDPRGNVRRCPCHPTSIGNLLKNDFTTIWSGMLNDFRSLSWTGDACKSCALLEQCKGGCSVSSPECTLKDCPEGFAADIFSDRFIPFESIPAHGRQVRGLLGQNIIAVKPVSL